MIRFLVVEDDLVSRAKLVAILCPHGECDQAEHGELGLDMFRRALLDGQPYQLVALDVTMPHKNGLEVLRQMRDLERNLAPRSAPAKIIMVTSHAEKEIVAQCIQSGCNDYIMKPFDPEMVVKKLRINGITLHAPQADK